MYYLFAAFPIKFQRYNSCFIPKKPSIIKVKNRNVVTLQDKRPDFFKLLCNLKFKSFGGLRKPGQGSKYKRRFFQLHRVKIFYGNYS